MFSNCDDQWQSETDVPTAVCSKISRGLPDVPCKAGRKLQTSPAAEFPIVPCCNIVAEGGYWILPFISPSVRLE